MQGTPLMSQWGEGTAEKPWVIKTVLFGDRGAGKATVWSRLIEEDAPKQPDPAWGLEAHFSTSHFPALRSRVQYSIPLHQNERGCQVSSSHCRGNHLGIVVVRSSLSGQSLEIQKVMAAFEESKDNPYREYILVSNVDKTKPREFTTAEAEGWATKHNMMFVEVDATEDVGPILIEKLKEALDKVLLNIDRFPKQTAQPNAAPQQQPDCNLV